MKIKIRSLEKIIAYKFNDKDKLIKSLTHKSFSSTSNNEKLEFLGDRVLGLIISKKILELYPNYNEGSLDKKLASLVNKKKCLEIAKKIKLQNYIIISGAKNKFIKIEDKILADSCEALIGAIFVDSGLIDAEIFINKFWKEHLFNKEAIIVDPKTRLQEYSLKINKVLPVYKLISNTGPRHKPLFRVAVKLKDSQFVSASGYSKKDAEQNAASLLIQKVKI
jgi:ribonuclease-3|tara:strand:- start:43 stop:708 length:666 start_codon:yes stop_codon:yes gene_type:complete